jgi:hypothetical protein
VAYIYPFIYIPTPLSYTQITHSPFVSLAAAAAIVKKKKMSFFFVNMAAEVSSLVEWIHG